MKQSLIALANSLASVEDYRHSSIERMERKILTPFTVYGDLCKTAKESVRKMVHKSNAQTSGQVNQGKVGILSRGPKKEAVPESVLSALPSPVELYAVQVDGFEKKKQSDVKKLLSDFVRIQLHFHAKAIEILSQGFQSIMALDETADMQEFRQFARITSLVSLDPEEKTKEKKQEFPERKSDESREKSRIQQDSSGDDEDQLQQEVTSSHAMYSTVLKFKDSKHVNVKD